MWITAKNLLVQTRRYLCELDNEELCNKLVDGLTANFNFLKNPLENKPKNPTNRSTISKVGQEVTLTLDQKVVIDENLKNETVILSDLYDINELDALELIVTAELQLRNFRMLTRGLVAVVLYFETHRFYVQILKDLLILKSNDEEIPSRMRNFVDGLVGDVNLFNKLINVQTNKVNVKTEFDKLLQPTIKGLGGSQHQAILREIIEDMEKTCFEILCMMALHCPTENQSNTLNNLLIVLRKMNPNVQFTVSQLAIWTVVNVFINPTKLKEANNPNMVFEIFRSQLEQSWENPCIQATIMFAFAISVKVVQKSTGVRGPRSYNETKLVELSIQNMTFQFLQAFIVGVPNFSSYWFLVDTMDSLVKNFICYFPDKLQEIFNLSEEEAELLANDQIQHQTSFLKGHQHFKAFLELIKMVYAANTEQIRQFAESFVNHDQLRNFVYQGRSITEPHHFIKYLETLATLCKSEKIARFLFKFFQFKDADSYCDWDNLFMSLRKYLDSFRSSPKMPAFGSLHAPVVSEPQKIQPLELIGLLQWLNLAEIVARQDPESRRQIYENRQWNCIEVIAGMLASAFPLPLKGAFYRFLSALAEDEHAALRIWDAFFREGISYVHPQTGKLDGIQRELEERECPAKMYDCTHGYLMLMKELFSRKNIPLSEQMEPYLKYITKSFLCQFAMRSYENVQQMWEMVTIALDALYELLRRFYVSAAAVHSQTSRIHVLAQLLNDSPLSRSISQVIIEAADRIEDSSPRDEHREIASLSAIRLLWIAISHRASMAEAIRNADSSIIISSLEALLLTPLPARNTTNYTTLFMAFVGETDFLLKHTFYVVKILRELCCQRPSLQSRIVQALLPHQEILKDLFARLTSVSSSEEVMIAPTDVPLMDLDDCTPARMRGETIRQIIELMIDSLEIDPKTNITFLLLGFDMKSVQQTKVITQDVSGEGTSCLHSFLQIIGIFISTENPFSLPYSVLFEPTLRLLLKLVSFNINSSSIMLRYLRSNHDLIYKLVVCPAFQNTERIADIEEVDVDVAHNILRRAIQGIILHLVALEVSTMLKSGLMSEPERFYAALLFVKETQQTPTDRNPEDTQNDHSIVIEERQNDVALLWTLLQNSKAEADQADPPILEKFDPKKVDELLTYCFRPSSLGVEQFDVEYLHFLLNMEINSIINEEINIIRNEGTEILLYCTKYNARRMLEAACVQLLSGWISMINVISFFAPVNFVDHTIQKHFLRDALYLLLTYARDVDMTADILTAVSNSIFRLVRAITGMVKQQESNLDLRKVELSYILSTLLECLVLPGYSKCLSFKMDVYGSIMCVFAACNESPDAPAEKPIRSPRGLFLADLLEDKQAVEDKWCSIFHQMAEEIVRTVTADVIFAPFALKVVAITSLAEILREDTRGSQEIAMQFARSGTIRCILDTVEKLKFNFENAQDREHQKAALYFESILSLFIRVATTSTGWTALIDNSLLEKIADLELWRSPPKELFTSKNYDNLSTNSMHYLRILDSLLRLCMALCSCVYWKSASYGILQVIEVHREVLNQLIRVQPEHFLLRTASTIVYYVYTLDKSTHEAIISSKCLDALRKFHSEGPPQEKFDLSKPAFNTPMNLFPTMPTLGRS